MVSKRDSYFGNDFEFTTKDGLMLAFGLTAYDNNIEPIDDATYGELKAFYKTWGLPGDPHGVNWVELPTKQCTREQLGYKDYDGQVNEESLFYPVHKNSEYDVNLYRKKFKCVEDQNLKILGDYNSGVTRSFVILFLKCDPDNTSGIQCKSDEEIIKWLRRKFILTYNN